MQGHEDRYWTHKADAGVRGLGFIVLADTVGTKDRLLDFPRVEYLLHASVESKADQHRTRSMCLR